MSFGWFPVNCVWTRCVSDEHFLYFFCGDVKLMSVNHFPFKFRFSMYSWCLVFLLLASTFRPPPPLWILFLWLWVKLCRLAMCLSSVVSRLMIGLLLLCLGLGTSGLSTILDVAQPGLASGGVLLEDPVTASSSLVLRLFLVLLSSLLLLRLLLLRLLLLNPLQSMTTLVCLQVN